MAQTAGVLGEPTDSGWPDARVLARDMHGNLRNEHLSRLNNLGNEIPPKLNIFSIIILQIPGGHSQVYTQQIFCRLEIANEIKSENMTLE